MNQYEKLYKEILNQTESNDLCWRQVARHANAELILNADEVLRQYEASFCRNGQIYKLLLVDKRYTETDFFFRKFELREPELHIVDEGELVTSLNQLYIDASQLCALLGLVEPQCDRSRRLLAEPAPSAA
jgi:hypothetical protein